MKISILQKRISRLLEDGGGLDSNIQEMDLEILNMREEIELKNEEITGLRVKLVSENTQKEALRKVPNPNHEAYPP